MFIQSITLILLSSSLMIILYLNKGSEDHVLAICDSLGKYASMKCDWWGPIFALGLELQIGPSGKSNLFFYIHNDASTYFGFIFYIIYGLFPLFVFLKYMNFNHKIYYLTKNKIFVLWAAAFLFSLPLYNYAEDWSRWFSIHFHLFAFLSFFLIQLRTVNYENNSIINKINYLFLSQRKKIFLITLLFLYSTSFHHHHFFFKGVKLEFTYYKIFKKIKRNF